MPKLDTCKPVLPREVVSGADSTRSHSGVGNRVHVQLVGLDVVSVDMSVRNGVKRQQDTCFGASFAVGARPMVRGSTATSRPYCKRPAGHGRVRFNAALDATHTEMRCCTFSILCLGYFQCDSSRRFTVLETERK